MKKLLIVMVCGLVFSACDDPTPTKSIFTQQRKTPFFKVLVYEVAPTFGSSVQFILFEDEAENCYITSGVDGGVVVAPLSACTKAKELIKLDIEKPQQNQ